MRDGISLYPLGMSSQGGELRGSRDRGSFLHDLFEEVGVQRRVNQSPSVQNVESLLSWHIYRSPNEQRRFVHVVKDLYQSYKVGLIVGISLMFVLL